MNERSFDFDLISKAASIYGEQSIVCIDAKSAFGGYNVYGEVVRINIKLVLMILLKSCKCGAGEIIINQLIMKDLGTVIWCLAAQHGDNTLLLCFKRSHHKGSPPVRLLFV
jgi:hypothetical protein